MQTSKNIKNNSTAGTSTLAEERSFDAWGRLRNPTNWSYTLGTTGVSTGKLSLTNRGFTGHEHLPSFGIINMNGRVYDPVVARFMSPDNFVQAPNNTQSFNRYSYVLNNPLKYTDPTGWNEELPHEQGQNSAWTETTLSLLADMGGQWGQMASSQKESGNYKEARERESKNKSTQQIYAEFQYDKSKITGNDIITCQNNQIREFTDKNGFRFKETTTTTTTTIIDKNAQIVSTNQSIEHDLISLDGGNGPYYVSSDKRVINEVPLYVYLNCINKQ